MCLNLVTFSRHCKFHRRWPFKVVLIATKYGCKKQTKNVESNNHCSFVLPIEKKEKTPTLTSCSCIYWAASRRGRISYVVMKHFRIKWWKYPPRNCFLRLYFYGEHRKFPTNSLPRVLRRSHDWCPHCNSTCLYLHTTWRCTLSSTFISHHLQGAFCFLKTEGPERWSSPNASRRWCTMRNAASKTLFRTSYILSISADGKWVVGVSLKPA